MPDDQPVSADQATSEPGTEALRTDKDGAPVYAEWSEDYAWSVDANHWPGFDNQEEATPDGGGLSDVVDPEEIYDPTPVSQQIEVQNEWDAFRRKVITSHFTAESLLDGVEKIYSTKQAGSFFGRSPQWIYWGLRSDPETGEHVFTYKDGTPIQPERIGPGGRRRFKLPIIREIALACYRRGNLTEEELTEVMSKILLAEFGEAAFASS